MKIFLYLCTPKRTFSSEFTLFCVSLPANQGTMYLEEIYRQEQCVRNCVILHREGMFWKAYEKSAYLFCTHIKPFKATKKRIKYMGGQEMISIGIEDGTEDAYFARFTLAET